MRKSTAGLVLGLSVVVIGSTLATLELLNRHRCLRAETRLNQAIEEMESTLHLRRGPGEAILLSSSPDLGHVRRFDVSSETVASRSVDIDLKITFDLRNPNEEPFHFTFCVLRFAHVRRGLWLTPTLTVLFNRNLNPEIRREVEARFRRHDLECEELPQQ